MKSRHTITLSAVSTFAALGLAACVVGEPGPPIDDAPPETLEEHVADNYIVVLRDGVGSSTALVAADIHLDTDILVGRAFEVINAYTFHGTAEDAALIASRPEVAYVEPDRITSLSLPGYCKWIPEHPLCDEPADEEPPSDPPADEPPSGDKPSWCIHIPNHPLCTDDGGAPAQTIPWGITRVGGDLGTASSVAWVVDSGVDLDNTDLNLDLGRTANFVSTETTRDDLHGHGTHVAGTIAAIDNDVAVVGVASGSTVVGVRVLNRDGSGSISDIIAGIDYVAQNAAAGDVANMSLGGKGNSAALDDAIRRAADRGIKFALAAGNDGADASGYLPASLNYPGVYTVSAIDDLDCLASFSNYGEPVDVAAPGVDVESLAAGGGTVSFNGTSMAAPHVAGLLLHNSLSSDGNINCDVDGTPEPIAHR